MGAVNLNPIFNPEELKVHLQQLTHEEGPAEHSEILKRLLSQLEASDFEALAFPKAINMRKKLSEIEEQLKLPDGRFDTSEALEPARTEWKKLTKQLEKMRLAEKHLLVLSVDETLKAAQKHDWSICKNHDFIYLFNGAFWSELDKEVLQKFLGEAAQKLGVNEYSARFYQFREKLFKQFLGTAYLPTPEGAKDSVLINLKNGTFEITPNGYKLRPFSSTDFLTYQLPFEFNPDVQAPQFQTYLNKVLPDMERQRVLAEYLGYIFVKHGTGSLKEEKALVLYGTGANGKSVFFEIVNALLGIDNVSSFSLQSLTNENGYFRAKLANKLLNYATEINGKLETDTFKQLVSGEPVEARLPYGQPFILRQYAKMIFNCNELPREVEHSNAFFRRFLIIPFDVTIPEAEQDKTLHTRIIDSELSGVFNWVLGGLNRLLEQQRFSKCDAAEKAVQEYRTQTDSVRMFLEENSLTADPVKWKLLKEIFATYRSFCTENGFHALNKTNFNKRLTAFGVQVDRKNIGMVVFLSSPNDL